MITRGRLTVAIVTLLAGLALALWLKRPSPPLADLPAMVREIHALNELVTVKYKVQKVVGIEEQKPIAGSERLLLIVQADVLGGVDLNALQATNLQWSGTNRVLVRLPRAKVLHVVLDEKQTKVWDRSVTWWTPWVPFNPDLERRARLAAIASIEENAVEMGLLQQAQRNAEASIARLLRSLGLEAVSFGS